MEPKKLYRSTDNRIVAGIAAGMANYFNLDPTVLRVAWIILTILTGGMAILAYLILIFVIPNEPENSRKKVKNNGPRA